MIWEMDGISRQTITTCMACEGGTFCKEVGGFRTRPYDGRWYHAWTGA